MSTSLIQIIDSKVDKRLYQKKHAKDLESKYCQQGYYLTFPLQYILMRNNGLEFLGTVQRIKNIALKNDSFGL